MSKIGKINISIPEKVKVALAGNIINIEGPLGKKSINVDLDMFNLDIIEGKEISIKPKKVDQNSKRLWGMNRSLINNAVIGSSKGYEKTLELVGVGYRAALKGNQLNLQLGYSHDINFDIPEGIKIAVEKQTILNHSVSSLNSSPTLLLLLTAILKFATGFPSGVYLSSGSWPTFPISITLFKLAILPLIPFHFRNFIHFISSN